MEPETEKKILARIKNPGWVTVRGVLSDPLSSPDSDEYVMIEKVMRSLGDKGLVTLWTLVIGADGVELLTAARPGFELDKDLENRGAWAKAVRYDIKP